MYLKCFFLYFHFWRIFLLGTIFEVFYYFTDFTPLYSCLHCFQWKIYDHVCSSTHNMTFVFGYFSSKNLLFIFASEYLVMLCVGSVSFLFLVLMVHWDSLISMFVVFTKFLKNSATISSNSLFCPLFQSFLPFWDSKCTYFWDLKLFHNSLVP